MERKPLFAMAKVAWQRRRWLRIDEGGFAAKDPWPSISRFLVRCGEGTLRRGEGGFVAANP